MGARVPEGSGMLRGHSRRQYRRLGLVKLAGKQQNKKRRQHLVHKEVSMKEVGRSLHNLSSSSSVLEKVAENKASELLVYSFEGSFSTYIILIIAPPLLHPPPPVAITDADSDAGPALPADSNATLQASISDFSLRLPPSIHRLQTFGPPLLLQRLADMVRRL
ncbi:hypothetical protein LXL04_037903 [Taraxacum kok-saghyz]